MFGRSKRVKPGDGRPLQRFRWWQLGSRALFHLRLGPADYAVDVRLWKSDDDGYTDAHLYRDGRLHAVSRVPAAFEVEGGIIEVATSSFGLRRCHYVTAAGVVHQLVPDPASAEGRRARLARNHPTLSRAIGLVSLILLIPGILLLLLQLLEPISEIPPLAERFGTFTSPLNLPWWLNVALTLGTAAASTERALRLRYRWWLDAMAN